MDLLNPLHYILLPENGNPTDNLLIREYTLTSGKLANITTGFLRTAKRAFTFGVGIGRRIGSLPNTDKDT